MTALTSVWRRPCSAPITAGSAAPGKKGSRRRHVQRVARLPRRRRPEAQRILEQWSDSSVTTEQRPMGSPGDHDAIGRRHRVPYGFIATVPDDVVPCSDLRLQRRGLRRSPGEEVHQREPSHAQGDGAVHHALQRRSVPALSVTRAGVQAHPYDRRPDADQPRIRPPVPPVVRVAATLFPPGPGVDSHWRTPAHQPEATAAPAHGPSTATTPSESWLSPPSGGKGSRSMAPVDWLRSLWTTVPQKRSPQLGYAHTTRCRRAPLRWERCQHERTRLPPLQEHPHRPSGVSRRPHESQER
jgi:hypothetical protein